MKKIDIVIFERGTDYRKGRLSYNNEDILYTIERSEGWVYQTDLLSDIQAKKEKYSCAIPYGTYNVNLIHSEKFNRIVPHIMNVPGFGNIEIHVGNSSKDTEGCILIGLLEVPGKDWISASSTAFRLLMSYLNDYPLEQIQLTLSSK